MQRATAALTLVFALLAAPGTALAQSAGDEQYVDPFQGGQGGGQAEQPEPEPEPAPQPEQPAAPAPEGGAAGSQPTTEAAPTPDPAPVAPAQTDTTTLPRTGFPAVVIAAAGYALLLAGIALRRKA
jgi:hypothetical protein